MTSATIQQGVMQFDVNELIQVYMTMLKADKINGTEYAQDQAAYITGCYPRVVLD